MKIVILKHPHEPLFLNLPTTIKFEVVGGNKETIVHFRVRDGLFGLQVNGVMEPRGIRSCRVEEGDRAVACFEFKAQKPGPVKVDFFVVDEAAISVVFNFSNYSLHLPDQSDWSMNGKRRH